MAAWCPCSTAQMMFSGPQAASPPQKTPGRVVWKVVRSTTGISHSLNSMPMSRSIQGKAVSWPMATMTSSQGIVTVSRVRGRVRPSSPLTHSTRSNSIPTRRPSSTTKLRGAWFSTISTCSPSASSSSQGEALKSFRPRRAMTFTLSAPSRSALRQQSMAVFPTPMTSTRGRTASM